MAAFDDSYSPDYPYKMLARDLRQRARQLGPNARLPSLAYLEQETGRSVKTIQRAVKLLVDEGVLVVIPGLGIFTAPPPED